MLVRAVTREVSAAPASHVEKAVWDGIGLLSILPSTPPVLQKEAAAAAAQPCWTVRLLVRLRGPHPPPFQRAALEWPRSSRGGAGEEFWGSQAPRAASGTGGASAQPREKLNRSRAFGRQGERWKRKPLADAVAFLGTVRRKSVRLISVKTCSRVKRKLGIWTLNSLPVVWAGSSFLGLCTYEVRLEKSLWILFFFLMDKLLCSKVVRKISYIWSWSHPAIIGRRIWMVGVLFCFSLFQKWICTNQCFENEKE
ncbi:uncharacterized protein LOC112541984 [Python bivittatus]|uniref:Uncharacterized protein LOC112541984 n=1 Tax=Python bivittatus TaxID=176946 RepID=A0A9F5J4D3_PYTBI|nr:uncharacterized protein LOC112541984 [Python bivittatus]